ncbi:7-deoxyloganetin glucosyltransferase [Physcomitrium patens]|uniref:Glycosyltransferase n=1 Tax=Physcomitrium patens TaxID=3218 RepID=A0A2K1ICC9_PHYPA|nr:7-deoxyloganetin glucosyltransferase-like [Physcomitrium patens]PNR26940.1 hypothetical protein PHYPA_030421 [Physcomitrium patens]|eukprot:XP_024366402.1 7-deoxyloganetin glucosyltransferase-like [Physcomitrella patens]
MKIEHRNGNAVKTLHAVIVPFPAQGHITPCLQLAKKLVRLGFHITFINTIHNHDRMMKSCSKDREPDEDIEFVAVSDGLPDDHPRLADLGSFCSSFSEMGPVFAELFEKLLRKSPITCVIHDVAAVAVHEPVKKLGILVVGIVTPSAISLQCYWNIETFIDAGILPLPPPPTYILTPSLDPVKLTLGLPRSDQETAIRDAPLTCLPGVSPTMRVNDIPTFLQTHDLNSYFIRFFRFTQNPLLPDCECLLFNTFHDLEGEILDAMTDINSNIYFVGPLVFNSTENQVDEVEELSLAATASALWKEDPLSLSWLDNQKQNSVLFVSFGSIATMSIEQMQELALGLEMSGHAFLWVIRSDLIEDTHENKEFQIMLSDIMQRTQDRALLVPWVEQIAVLSHPSVAAFLTHCGWNSTIESISTGVPMLCWPRFAEQNTNCHYIKCVWEIGLDFKSQVKDDTTIVSKEEVAKKVRKIMAIDGADLEIDKIRTNARNLRIAARKAVSGGGSSHTAFMKFVQQIEKTSKLQLPS